MKAKKFITLIISAVMACMILASCASDIDTGDFEAEAPSGWGLCMPTIDGKEQTNQIYVIKDGKEPLDRLSHPSMWITYYKDPSKYSEQKDFYKDSEDISSFETDGKKWEGFKYTSFGKASATVKCKDGDALWVCVFTFESGSDKFSIDDEAVKEVLGSLKAK
ncbi:MAG: hypothetical protein J5956_06005 [Ruminococcus sp.]|nr:hypothetical protein [Ruminococcus sp.]